MRRSLAVVIAGGLLAACSLGAFDGYSNGAPDGPDAGDAAVPDVASNLDTGAVTDSSGSDGGAKRFCESLVPAPRTCADFDEGKLPLGFEEEELSGGTVSLDMSGKDGTGGLVSIVSPSADDAHACIVIPLPGPRTGVTVEADFRVEVLGSLNYDILNFDSTADRELGVSMTGTSIHIEEDVPTDGGESEHSTVVSGSVKDTWQRLRFVVTVDGATATGELFIDGISAGKLTGVNPATMTGSTRFEVGDCSLGGANGWTVHLDNVVLYEKN